MQFTNKKVKVPNPYKLICEKFYFIGYEQLFLSRKFRRAIAKTEMHRAWLAGNQGNIGVVEGVEHGSLIASIIQMLLSSSYGAA